MFRVDGAKFREHFQVSPAALEALRAFRTSGGDPPWEHASSVLSGRLGRCQFRVDCPWATGACRASSSGVLSTSSIRRRSVSCILTRPRGVHRTRGTRMPEPCSPVELALVEFQIAGGAQGAVGELQPQRLIDADAIAAASAYEGRSVVVHEGDALEALTRTRLCPTVRRPLCPGSGLLRTFCGDLRFHARWFRRLPGRPRGSWLGRPGEARRPAGRIGGS